MAKIVFKRKFICERLEDYSVSYNGESIKTETDAIRLLRDIYKKEEIDMAINEACFVVFLNANNTPLGYFKVSEGGIDSTTMDVRMIAKSALDALATGVILAHNHPSGRPSPSAADVKETTKVKKALALFSINVVDHIILTENECYSFASEMVIKG